MEIFADTCKSTMRNEPSCRLLVVAVVLGRSVLGRHNSLGLHVLPILLGRNLPLYHWYKEGNRGIILTAWNSSAKSNDSTLLSKMDYRSPNSFVVDSRRVDCRETVLQEQHE